MVEGEAGIGETTLWLAAVALAREREYRSSGVPQGAVLQR
jgi:hypothetical protein